MPRKSRAPFAIIPAVLAAVLFVPQAASAAGDRPAFQLPFECGQTWAANTYNGHKPNSNSVDLTIHGAASAGQPILASASGRVTFAGWDNGGGWMVNVAHENGWGTSYLHMAERPDVTAGQEVAQGTVLGHVGSTGDSSGPHLHYQQWAGDPGNTVPAVIDGMTLGIWPGHGQALTSRNCGGGGDALGTDGDAPGLSFTPDGKSLFISARTRDGQIGVTNSSATNIAPWYPVGGWMASGPATAWTPSGTAFYTAAQGTDGTVWVNDWNAERGNSGWYSIGGEAASAPAITWSPDGKRLQVAARSADGTIRIREWTEKDKWGDWRTAGKQAASGVSLAWSPDGKSLTMAVRRSDGKVWVASAKDGKDFGDWRSLGGEVTSAPSIVWTPDGKTLNVAGRGKDGAVQVAAWAPGSDAKWTSIGGEAVGAPALAWSVETKSLHVAVRGSDGGVWVNDTAGASEWNGWYSVGAP